LAAEAIRTGLIISHPLPMSAWQVGVAAFYLLPTRAWELGLGAVVAMLGEPPRTGPRLRTTLAAAALALLAASLLVSNPSSYAPLPAASFACIATAVLIWSGQGDNRIARLVGARPLAAVGLISYSLYLWHWPILVFSRYYLLREPTAAEAIALLSLTAAIAAASWRYVERPFRGSRIPTPLAMAMVAAPAAALGAAAYAITAAGGAPGRLPAAAVAIDRAASVHFECPPSVSIPFGGIRGCLLGPPGHQAADTQVVLFGNSHAATYAPAVEAVLVRRNLHGLLVTSGGCLPVGEFNLTHECAGLMRGAIEAVARLPSAEVVIIATTWPRDDEPLVDAAGHRVTTVNSPRYLTALGATLDRFARAGKRVVLVGPVPWPGFEPASVAAREIAFRGRTETPLSQPRAAFDARFGPVEQWLGKIAARATVVQPSTLLCDSATCAFEVDGKPAFSNGGHLSILVMPSFEPLFAGALARAWPQPRGGR
jgi:hypothetical protein